MATDPHAPDTSHGGAGHEASDVDVSRAPMVFVASVVFLAVVLGAMWLTFRAMEGRLVQADRPLSPLSERQPGEDRLPPEPRLLTDEPANLATFRAREDAALADIDRAMTALVERGMPAAAPAPDLPEPPPVNPAAGSPAPAVASAAAREAAASRRPAAAPIEEAPAEPETDAETDADGATKPPQVPPGESPREP